MPNAKDTHDIPPKGLGLGPNSPLALKKVSGCFYRRRMLASTSRRADADVIQVGGRRGNKMEGKQRRFDGTARAEIV